MDRKDVALALLAGTEGIYTIGLFCPSLMTMDAFAKFPQQVAMVRRGAWIAGGFAALIGVATSLVAENWLPLWFSLAGWFAAYMVYEHTLSQGSGTGPMAEQI